MRWREYGEVVAKLKEHDSQFRRECRRTLSGSSNSPDVLE